MGTPPRYLHRGERMVASTGLAIAAILLIAVAGGGGWTVYSHRQMARQEITRSVEQAGKVLVTGIEPMLANNRSMVEVLLRSAMSEHEFRRCRVVSAEGHILADALPPKLTIRRGGTNTPIQAEPIPPRELTDPRLANLSLPLALGVDKAHLELSKAVVYPRWAGWEAVTGLGVTGVLGLGALLMVYRRLRSRLRGVGAIGEALKAMQRGETSPAALSVSSTRGPVAR